MLINKKTVCAQGQKSSMGPETGTEPGIEGCFLGGKWDALMFRCPVGSPGILCFLVEWLQLRVLAGNDVVL